MTVDDIQKIVDEMRRHGVCRIEYEAERESLLLVLNPSAAPTVPEDQRKPAKPVSNPIRSQAMGRFHSSHPGAAQSMTEPGHIVSSGACVGFIQIGPILLPLIAPKDGRIARQLAADGEIVEFGQALFELEDTPMPQRTGKEE